MTTPNDPFSLAQWRRTVAELYAIIRRTPAAEQHLVWQKFRESRDRLFKYHPQSPLTPDQRQRFRGLDYFPYRLDWRLTGRLEPDVERETFMVNLPADGVFQYTRVARVQFVTFGREAELELYWIDGYGGGLFLPFQDGTSDRETYGGGRYLIDTIKGVDLGVGDDKIVLDFNYAYNPSCAYNDSWFCPLAPAENRLWFAIEAGEKQFEPVGGGRRFGAVKSGQATAE